jgi:PPM family protein phosphatase
MPESGAAGHGAEHPSISDRDADARAGSGPARDAAEATAAVRRLPGTAPGPPQGLPEGATAAHALAERERAERRKARDRHPARSLGRFARFLVPIVLILGLAVAVTAWYARRTYFVAFDRQGQVTVYQGRPGGLLVWDPTIVRHTEVTRSELTEAARLDVEDRKQFDDKGAAIAFVGRVEARAAAATSTTSTTTTTVTTLPAVVPST